MLETIVTKIILGVSLAAPIGPVNAEMIKRGLVSGFWGSFSVRLGGAVANSICLLIAYFGLGKLIQHPMILLIVSCIGEIIIIYIGITTIMKAMSKNFMSSIDNKICLETNKAKQHYSIKNGLAVGLALAFTSPVGLMFWLGTFAATIQQEATTKVSIYNLLINFFIIAGVLIWGAFVSLILHFGSKIIDQKKLRIISALSGLILIYFGVKYGINSFNIFKNLFL
jgi:threonine/homoserine/homoserine lactone efflux protein